MSEPSLPAATLDPEVVITRSGAKAIRDRLTGELMHPVVGPLVEAEHLYVGPSRLRERSREAGEPLVLFDVGLGAGSNALAAWCAAREVGARRLHIVSFDQSVDAMALAVSDAHAASFGFEGEALEAGRALLRRGHHESAHATWELRLGDLWETLPREARHGDVVYWDPFSAGANPALWTTRAFSMLHPRCGANATVHTYGGATSTRAAMLLAGFAVGEGPILGEVVPPGKGKRGTIAATRLEDLERPLDARWLTRLERSSAPWPIDAPADAFEVIRSRPQFAR